MSNGLALTLETRPEELDRLTAAVELLLSRTTGLLRSRSR